MAQRDTTEIIVEVKEAPSVEGEDNKIGGVDIMTGEINTTQALVNKTGINRTGEEVAGEADQEDLEIEVTEVAEVAETVEVAEVVEDNNKIRTPSNNNSNSIRINNKASSSSNNNKRDVMAVVVRSI